MVGLRLDPSSRGPQTPLHASSVGVASSKTPFAMDFIASAPRDLAAIARVCASITALMSLSVSALFMEPCQVDMWEMQVPCVSRGTKRDAKRAQLCACRASCVYTGSDHSTGRRSPGRRPRRLHSTRAALAHKKRRTRRVTTGDRDVHRWRRTGSCGAHLDQWFSLPGCLRVDDACEGSCGTHAREDEVLVESITFSRRTIRGSTR